MIKVLHFSVFNILYSIKKMNETLFIVTTAPLRKAEFFTVVIGEKNINGKLVFRHRRPFMPRV